MKKNVEMVPFLLLLVGTLGLLLNEFLFAWGRATTLAFAIANLIGLVILGFSYFAKK